MTEEKFKVLAELVIVNNQRMNELHRNLNSITEIFMDGNEWKHSPAFNRLRSSIDQQDALSDASDSTIAEAREFFGLPPAGHSSTT